MSRSSLRTIRLGKSHPLKDAPKGEQHFDVPVSTVTFKETFQFDFVKALCQNRTFALRMVGHLQPYSHFETPQLQWCSDYALNYWARFSSSLSATHMLSSLQAQVEHGRITRKDVAFGISRLIKEQLFTPIQDEEFIIHTSYQWMQQQIRAQYIEDLAVAMKHGDIAKQQEIWTKGAALDIQNFVSPESYAKDGDHAIERRKAMWTEGIKTNLPPDKYMARGGFPRPTVNCIVGPTNTGKTSVCGFLGGQFVLQGLNVLHVTLETTIEDLCDMYDSIRTGHERFNVYRHPDECRSARADFYKEFGDSLHYVRYIPRTVTMAQIRSLIYLERASGFRPDVLILDSADDILPYAGYRESEYQRGDDIYVGLIVLAELFNLCIIATTQGNRESLGSSVVHLGMVGDSIKKVQRADSVLALCQNYKQSKMSPAIMGLFFAKSRFGPKNQLSFVRCYNEFCHYVPVLPGDPDYNHIRQTIMLDDGENSRGRRNYER